MKHLYTVAMIALIMAPILAFAEPEEPVAYPPEFNERIIRNVFGDKAEEALIIARCETKLNNLAVNYDDKKLNGHPSRGLFQISGIHGELEEWHNPWVNAMKAKELYEKRGWKPWLLCSKKITKKPVPLNLHASADLVAIR